MASCYDLYDKFMGADYLFKNYIGDSDGHILRDSLLYNQNNKDWRNHKILLWECC